MRTEMEQEVRSLEWSSSVMDPTSAGLVSWGSSKWKLPCCPQFLIYPGILSPLRTRGTLACSLWLGNTEKSQNSLRVIVRGTSFLFFVFFLALVTEEYSLFQGFPVSKAWNNLGRPQWDYAKWMSETMVSTEPFHFKCPPRHQQTYNDCILYTLRCTRKTFRDFFFFSSVFYKYKIYSYHRFEHLRLVLSFLFIFTVLSKGNTMASLWRIWTDRTVLLCFGTNTKHHLDTSTAVLPVSLITEIDAENSGSAAYTE